MLSNKNKIKRIQWQIDELGKGLIEGDNQQFTSAAIVKRINAIEFLKRTRKQLSWEDVRKQFGFDYLGYRPSPNVKVDEYAKKYLVKLWNCNTEEDL